MKRGTFTKFRIVGIVPYDRQTMIDVRRVAGVVLLAADVLTASSLAAADTPKPKDAPGRLVIDQDLTSMQAARNARALAQKGDCNGALDEFDLALRTSHEPELYRDRGVCHEKLDHPYPAIADYREYLFARPNAKDADDIRARLQRLEGAQKSDSVGTRSDAELEMSRASGDTKKATEEAKADDSGEAKGEKAEAKVSVEASASSDHKTDAKGSFEAEDAAEKKLDSASDSPLRLGKGFAIGPVFGLRRWFSDSLGWSESIVASFRYSFGAVSSLQADVGFVNLAGTGNDASLSGFTTYLGYEARLGLDEYVNNAIVLGAGGGFDRLSERSIGATFSVFEGRARGGFRHVFGPSLGLEVLAEAGLGNFHLNDAPAGVDASITKGFFGGTVGLVVGF